jgi:hypothetical protein
MISRERDGGKEPYHFLNNYRLWRIDGAKDVPNIYNPSKGVKVKF